MSLQSHVCLALTCVANIGGREMAETLAADIQRLLVSQYVPRCKQFPPSDGDGFVDTVVWIEVGAVELI
jgi:hypothetical protein